MIPDNQPSVSPDDTLTLTEAFSMVVVTRAQCSQLFGILADILRDGHPGISASFNEAVNEVLGR